jgi:hypothetical protein
MLTAPAALPPRVFPDISRTHTRRAPGPRIVDVSPLHLVSLLFRLPAPVPPRLFSGGTPAATPPATPSQPPTQESLRELVNALAQAQAQAQAVAQGQARGDSVTATQRQAGVRRDETDGESESEEEGIETTDDDEESQLVPRQERRGGRRIPGDYWTSRATG